MKRHLMTGISPRCELHNSITRSLRQTVAQVTIVVIWCFGCAASAQLLRPQDINKLPSAPADHRIRYGSDPLQFADLRLPTGKGPFRVTAVIHGGCWISTFADLQNTAALSDATIEKAALSLLGIMK